MSFGDHSSFLILVILDICLRDAKLLQSSSDSVQSYDLQPARFLWSVGFSRQEYWSGLPCAPPGNLSDSGIETVSLMSNLQWLAGFLPLATGKPIRVCACVYTFIYVCIYISPFGFLSHLGHYRALSRVLWSFPGGFSGKESA